MCWCACVWVCVCVCLSVYLYPPPFFSTRPSDCNQIWHAYNMWIDPGIIRAKNKFEPPHPRRSQGVSQIQKSGKCHELSRKSIKKVNPHPTGGGRGFGSFRDQKFGKCHERSRKSKHFFNPPPPVGVLD